MNAVVTQEPLPEPVARRGINESTWRTLKNSVFPGALSDSILMAVDYCQARKLDVLKKPCHIVPMNVKDAKSGAYAYRDVILPGIYEYRTTAMRTGLYLGHSEPTYGESAEHMVVRDKDGNVTEGVLAPMSCTMVMYRWNVLAQQKVPFPVTVYFREAVGLTKEGKINARWEKAPMQMLTKCTEAAGLREAFPEEIGGEPTMEEMIDNTIVAESTVVPAGSRTSAAAEALRAKQTPLKKTLKLAYSIVEGVALIRCAASLAELEKCFQLIRNDYDFNATELPLDIEANYQDRKETLQQGAAA
jgi:phage recombination protein Bet